MSINASTQLYGIIGNPVKHSLSPLLHNALFEHFKINAAYMAFEIGEDSLGLAFEAIRALGIKGVNVTVPFKELALDFIDEIPEDLDRGIGAINTVINKDGKLFGYNTDSPGFLQALREELSFQPKGKTVLVLGAGGAARGALFSLAYAAAEKIFIYNRTQERARGLKGYLEGFFPEAEIEVLGSLQHIPSQKIDLLVNATSCGMKKEDPLPFDLKLLQGKPSVYDLVYAPSETLLLKRAKELGWAHANGLGMLANQAALSFGLWTGHREGVREMMQEVLRKCRS